MASESRGGNRLQTDNPVVVRSAPNDRDETALSTRVLMALDSLPDYDVENSETVVFDHIDPDALDNLFDHVAEESRRGRVTFPIDRYEVTVTAAGEITISRASIGSQ